jgi:hypothetical protein
LTLDSNPLNSVAVPAGNPLLGQVFLTLRTQGVSVLLIPSAKSPRRFNGDFAFDVCGDLGNVVIQRSTDLKTWQNVGTVIITWPNYPGVPFTDTNGPSTGGAFYRLVLPLK